MEKKVLSGNGASFQNTDQQVTASNEDKQKA